MTYKLLPGYEVVCDFMKTEHLMAPCSHLILIPLLDPRINLTMTLYD